MTNKEQIFKDTYDNKGFKFSYSSMNRLRFSPKLFYKDYILKDREIRTDKHLIEGRLLHLLLLQPQNFDEEFIITPSKLPSDTLRKVIMNIMLYTDVKELSEVDDNIILDSLHAVGLYQSLKDSDKRIAKVRTTECEDYYTFSQTKGKDIIDQTMYDRTMERVSVVRAKEGIMNLLDPVVTDFELDETEKFAEAYLECELKDHKFGFKGYVDKYIIDHETGVITIIDIKTSGKSIVNFVETVEYYNYWMQAAVYTTLVLKNVPERAKSYKIKFYFIVVDTYNQVYNFEVSEPTMKEWGAQLMDMVTKCKFHLDEMSFDLPYEFLNNKVVL